MGSVMCQALSIVRSVDFTARVSIVSDYGRRNDPILVCCFAFLGFSVLNMSVNWIVEVFAVMLYCFVYGSSPKIVEFLTRGDFVCYLSVDGAR